MTQNTTRYTITKKHLFIQLGVVTAAVAVLIGGFAVTPGYGQATTTRGSFTMPIDVTTTPSAVCGFGQMHITGTANWVLIGTVGPDGKFEHTVIHVNYQGVSGTTAYGDRVVIGSAENVINNVRPEGANQAITQTHGTTVIQGKAVNFVAEISSHVVYNSNGQLTANVDRVDLRCV